MRRHVIDLKHLFEEKLVSRNWYWAVLVKNIEQVKKRFHVYWRSTNVCLKCQTKIRVVLLKFHPFPGIMKSV